MVGVLLGIVVVTLVMSVVYREIGPLQGRYALPVLVLIPLWTGEVLRRRRARLPAAAVGGLIAAVFAGTLAVHVLGLWASSRRLAVGDGLRWLFFADAAWSPPLGWPWLLVAVVAACAYLAIVMSVVYREIGSLHGRYVLPFLVLVPLWLGEVVLRRRARLPARVMPALVVTAFAAAGTVHLLGWWSSARRFAVGENGDWLFPGEAAWSPPLGWWTWSLVMAAAVIAYVVAGARSVGRSTA